MAVAVGSTTEAVLDNQRLGALQLRVAVLCALVQMCDGHDLNSVAWAVPSLIRAAAPARDDDHGYVYWRAHWGLSRWADRSIAARAMGLAHDFRIGRHIPVGFGAGSGVLAAGIATVFGNQKEAFDAQRHAPLTHGHRIGA
jgi:hypothetical protein